MMKKKNNNNMKYIKKKILQSLKTKNKRQKIQMLIILYKLNHMDIIFLNTRLDRMVMQCKQELKHMKMIQ